MTRKFVAVGIILTWITMVGWHVRREYYQPELTRLTTAAMALAPGLSFYTLKMGDRTVGQATSRLDTIPEGGFELEDMMLIDLPALGQTGSAVVRSKVIPRVLGRAPPRRERDLVRSGRHLSTASRDETYTLVASYYKLTCELAGRRGVRDLSIHERAI